MFEMNVKKRKGREQYGLRITVLYFNDSHFARSMLFNSISFKENEDKSAENRASYINDNKRNTASVQMGNISYLLGTGVFSAVNCI